MFRPILFLAIIKLYTIIGENYSTVQYNYQYTKVDGFVLHAIIQGVTGGMCETSGEFSLC